MEVRDARIRLNSSWKTAHLGGKVLSSGSRRFNDICQRSDGASLLCSRIGTRTIAETVDKQLLLIPYTTSRENQPKALLAAVNEWPARRSNSLFLEASLRMHKRNAASRWITRCWPAMCRGKIESFALELSTSSYRGPGMLERAPISWLRLMLARPYAIWRFLSSLWRE